MLNWEFARDGERFELRLDGKTVICHEPSRPWLALSELKAEYRMYRGNFQSSERTLRKLPLRFWSVLDEGAAAGGGAAGSVPEGGAGGQGQRALRLVMKPAPDSPAEECVTLRIAAGRGSRLGPEDQGRNGTPGLPPAELSPESLTVEFLSGPAWANGCALSLAAEPGEHAYGCGEQFSHFDLRGRHFPLWTSEQGVGRNKWTLTTRLADLADGAGGDYWWTFFQIGRASCRERV